MKRWAMVCAVVLVAACHSSTAPTPTVAGRWTGVVGTQVFDLTLVENSGVVSGTGTLTNSPTGTRALIVNGTFTNPTFTATLTSGTLQPFNLQATVAGNTMTGILNGSGFTGEGITLTRSS